MVDTLSVNLSIGKRKGNLLDYAFIFVDMVKDAAVHFPYCHGWTQRQMIIRAKVYLILRAIRYDSRIRKVKLPMFVY